MPCSKAKLVRKLLEEARAAQKSNVVELRRQRMVRESRVELIEALAGYCTAKCGGCPLTMQLAKDRWA